MTREAVVYGGQFGYGPIARCDPGEVVRLEGSESDRLLFAQRRLAALTPDTQVTKCPKCSRRFLVESLAIHDRRSHAAPKVGG